MRDKIEALSKVFKALGDPSRLNILRLLHQHKGALCVTAIANKMSITQSAVSQHLRVLRDIGLIRGNRIGAMMHYYVDEEVVSAQKTLFLDVFKES